MSRSRSFNTRIVYIRVMHNSSLPFASVNLINENTVHVVFQDLAEIDLEEAKELKESILAHTTGQKYILILDSAKQRIDISHAARDLLVQDDELNKDIICQAYIAKSMANKLIFHFFINFHKPEVPVQVFDSLNEAKAWIAKQKVIY